MLHDALQSVEADHHVLRDVHADDVGHGLALRFGTGVGQHLVELRGVAVRENVGGIARHADERDQVLLEIEAHEHHEVGVARRVLFPGVVADDEDVLGVGHRGRRRVVHDERLRLRLLRLFLRGRSRAGAEGSCERDGGEERDRPEGLSQLDVGSDGGHVDRLLSACVSFRSPP